MFYLALEAPERHPEDSTSSFLFYSQSLSPNHIVTCTVGNTVSETGVKTAHTTYLRNSLPSAQENKSNTQEVII